MSATEIIAELPKLTHEERRAICQRILALESDQEALELNRQAAVQGFQMLDQMEADDKARPDYFVSIPWRQVCE